MLKIGDWVHVRIVGIKLEGNTPAYQIESISEDNYVAVQKEGCYEHRVTGSDEKFKKL